MMIEDRDNGILTWEFNNNGVPIEQFGINITCESQNVFRRWISRDQQSNRIMFPVPLSLLPFNASCTASVQANNLLGYSTATETTFSTPQGNALNW